jgi:iron complex outermembrane receptor protein
MQRQSSTRAFATASSLPLYAPVVMAAFVGSLWPASAAAQDAQTAAQQSQPSQSETIIVTASPFAGEPDRFATIVTQVNRDDILQNGGANLADALRNVPGVSNTSFAAGASRPVIRGMDAFRVVLLENGVASSDVSEVGPDHGVPIDPLSARDIEVVRGAATLRWGSQAIGGVVNAINNRIPLTLPAAPLSGEWSAGYGTNATATDGSILLDARAGQFAFHADAFGRRASDYDIPDNQEMDNSFFHGGGYSAGGSYFFGDDNASRAGLAVTHYDARYGIPGEDTFIDMRQNKVTASSSLHLGDALFQALNFNGGYADYLHHEKDPDGNILSTFLNRETNARAELLLGAMGPLTNSAIGVQYGDRRFSGLGEAADFLLPTRTQTEALFAFTEAPLGSRVNVQAGARVEQVSVDGFAPVGDVPTSVDFTPVSGSIGILFDATDSLKLGLTISSAARAPGQVELFASGPHDGPLTFETGNPDLGIERANSIEATLRYRNGGFHFEGAVWGAQFSNYIFGFLTGNLCDDTGDCTNPPGGDLKELFYQQSDANFWGAEGRATLDLLNSPSGTLQGVALADYVRADLTHGGGPVPRIPPYRVGAGLNWNSPHVNAGAMLMYVGAQDHVPAGDTTTDSYVELDANVAWRPIIAQGFEIALVGHNLTDDVQRNAIALNRDLVELPGRDVRLVLRQSF